MNMEWAAEAFAEGLEYGVEDSVAWLRFRLSFGIVTMGVRVRQIVWCGVVAACGTWAKFLEVARLIDNRNFLAGKERAKARAHVSRL